ncbi:phenylalanyl-tRNA synthetase beta subunit [Leptotrichia trevisanii]|jgi:hypothetical protein|uniref:hypothetical protein n=1 Tax=Leptotrichia trevisanii TaxID=109328 RepID=UPI0011878217|nr:hypothetical protein [Leptotrichia trevisanii]BBM56185.1 phenylalanyl-tRNA synthetase beta subunit [Leptotrichia trevisanii]
MKKIEVIKRVKCLVPNIYKINGELQNIKAKGKIKIQEVDQNIIGIKFIKSKNINDKFSKLELQVFKELEEDNNIYIIDFNKWNNPQILNKELITENIDKNLFKYFKNRNEYATQIHLTIFNYKNLINSEDLESLLFTETPLSFLFLDIYDKQINDKNEFEVEYIIQSIPIDEKIPVKLIFKLDEKEKDVIKLNFRMDYYDNRMSRNVLVSKVRDLLKKEMFEKMDFELDLSGYYILDKENFKIREIKAEQRIKIDDKLYEREFFIKEETENIESEEKSDEAKEIIEKDEMLQIEIPKVENLNEKELIETEKTVFKKPKKPIEQTYDGIRDWLLPLLRKDDKIIFPKEEFLERVKIFDEAEKLRTFNVIKSAVEHDNYCVKFEKGKTIRKYEVIKAFGKMLGIAVEEEIVEKVEEKEEKKLTPQQLRKKKFLERMKRSEKEEH